MRSRSVLLVLLVAGLSLAPGPGSTSDIRRGELLWTYSVRGGSHLSSPPRVVAEHSRVLVAAVECAPDAAPCSARFRALSARDGTLLWERQHGPPVIEQVFLRLDGDLLLAAMNPSGTGGVLIAVSTRTGELVWSDEFSTEAFFSLRGLEVAEGRIALAGNLNGPGLGVGLIRVYDRRGPLLWERTTGADTRLGAVALDAAALVAGGFRLGPGRRRARLWSWDADSGSFRGAARFRNQQGVQALVPGDGSLYAAVGRSVVALGPDGAVSWRRREYVAELVRSDQVAMLLLDDRLVIQGSKGLRALSREDGTVLWRRGGAGLRSGIPAETAGPLVIAGDGQRPDGPDFGFVRLHDPASGRRVWVDRFRSETLSDVATLPRRVFVVGRRGPSSLYVRAYRTR